MLLAEKLDLLRSLSERCVVMFPLETDGICPDLKAVLFMRVS